MNDNRFFRFLQVRIGLDVESVGAGMVERALQQRCLAVKAQDLDDYWLHLQQSAAEQQALIEAVIVPETWFFRYPDSFAALVSLAKARLAERGPTERGTGRPLRLLSLPCSTGEEPYSMAMALLDGGLAPGSFSIDALDISPLSIARAEQALYGRNSFRGADLAFRERHFSEGEEGLHLHQRVRQQVTLQVGNVLDPALQARDGLYDFVFCRNLLIYFDLPTQQRVFEVLKRLMQVSGVLFIGPAEGSLLARLGMRPVGIAQSFAYVRHTPPLSAPQAAAQVARARTPVASAAPPFSTPSRRQPLLRPPSPPNPPSAATEPGNEREWLAQITRQANAGDSRAARASCERYLREFAPRAQVYYWLGLLSDTEGDAQQAQGHYRKALYLDPQHPEALMHLAALLAAQGDAAGARRLQERAARAAREAE